MSEQPRQMGRLAIRHEGDKWVAYYALPDTMKDAFFLGSIRMGVVTKFPERKQTFIDLMRDIVSDLIEAEFNVRPTWGGPQTAPEHERAGEA